MTRFKVKVFSLVLFACSAFAAAQTVETPKTNGQNDVKTQPVSFPGSQGSDESYRIGFQDTLDIQIFRHPELAQKVSVNSNGTINLFKIPAPLVAVCKTTHELATDVAAAYRKDYLRDPEVTVFAIEQRSQAFGIMGAIEKPGSYFINRKVNLLELLAQAGGPSKEAGTRLMVNRTGSTSNCKEAVASNPETDNTAFFDFKISDIVEGKQKLIMQPGDVVYVSDADVVYVYGNVIRQGQVVIKEPITLTQAIASSEGLKPATKKDVRILRQKPGSLEREALPFNLDDIDKQKVQDPYLQPNDIVAVSEDKVKSILNGIRSSLTQGLPSIFYRVP